jgi:hypothetical protein
MTLCAPGRRTRAAGSQFLPRSKFRLASKSTEEFKELRSQGKIAGGLP